MVVVMACHGGLGGIGIVNTMVIGVKIEGVSKRAHRVSTREYIGKEQRRAHVKQLFEILNAGVVLQLHLIF